MNPLKKKEKVTEGTSIIDIHCHPSLKTWLFDKKHIYDKVEPKGIERKISANLFVTIKKMIKGNVKAAVVAHYLPENEIITSEYKWLLDVFRKVLKNLCKGRDKILVENLSYKLASFDQMKDYITRFEAEIFEAKLMNCNVDIATDYKSFLKLLGEAGKIVFLHSIEGAHCLGNDNYNIKDKADLISYAELENSVMYLFKKGVCQFTIGHLFPNILVSSQGGIAKGLVGPMRYDPGFSSPGKNYDFPNGYNERDDNIAKKIITKILDIGIIIDLVHCHENAKELVYSINRKRKKPRPLVFSHTGVREIVKKYNKDLDDIYLNFLPCTYDIQKIKDCDGVLGIIFMNFWLFGNEGDPPIGKPKSFDAIPKILETIEFIKNVTKSNGKGGGTYDHIAIGTDLDGFTEVPPDLMGENQMTKLIEAMRNASPKPIPEDDIKKICSGNYMRVLKEGWGNNS